MNPITTVVLHGEVRFELHGEFPIPEDVRALGPQPMTNWLEQLVNDMVRAEASTRIDLSDVDIRFRRAET